MTPLKNISLSLADLAGHDYTDAVCAAQAFLSGTPLPRLQALAHRKVAFWPRPVAKRLAELVPRLGTRVTDGLAASCRGAGSAAFAKATNTAAAPLAGLGFCRVGEDGRLYFTAKSEHYHTPLGHQFPGYRLLENAARLGILNATHNNTRGHLTRLAEREIVRAAHGLGLREDAKLDAVIADSAPHVLNRVINLETGSLAVEAALKMMLARFYKSERTHADPVYQGRIPVFLVIGDRKGGRDANYHGTTLLTQTLRGMWPTLQARFEEQGIYRIRAVGINDLDDFRRAVAEFETPPYKIAGFFHELILMNYGAIRLFPEYLQAAHALCREHDIPVLVDEIQSCMWCPDMFLFREYGLKPDFVSVGKGFPGGQYCASKILFSGHLDTLSQFGALVTNGQEELASLSYLITIAFARANSAYIRELGEYYERELRRVAAKHSRVVTCVEGLRHLSSVFFATADQAVAFCKALNANGIDISAQTYKPDCPPGALTKLPLVTPPAAVDFLLARMDAALAAM